MRKKDKYTIGLLILLTISTAFLSYLYNQINFIILPILGLSALKFILVSFQFMELKKAHPFWRSLIIIFLIVFISAIYLIR